jgi:hypothetical protein
MSNTSNLVLPYLAVGQAQKHVTVNETLRKLDAIIQLSVVSATTAAEPSTPTDGAVYIVPAGKSGAHWSAFANWSLGYYRDGAWVEITPREGWLAFVRDTDQLLAYTGSVWSLFPAAKLLTVSATDKLIGRSTSGAGAAEEIALTAAGRALIDDADAAAQRATLGLGTAATVNTGASGAALPLLNAAVVWSGRQTFSYANTTIFNRPDSDPYKIEFQDGGVLRGYIRTSATNAFEVLNHDTSRNLTFTQAGGVILGAPSGGDKGAGTLNAAGVYDDNVLLSCYVFDQALDGAVDLAKWDAKVPDREIPAVTAEVEDGPPGADGQRPRNRIEVSPARTETRIHEAARRFAGRAGTEHDPLTLDGYARH